MTLKELSQLYYLNREIEMDKKRLLELEARAVSCSSDLSGIHYLLRGVPQEDAIPPW